MLGHRSAFLMSTRANSAIEFAMIMPILLVLVFGIIAYGSFLLVVHDVQQLAAEAARSSIAGLTDTERRQLATSYVSANAGAYPLLTASHLAVDAGATDATGNVYAVTVTYDASDSFIYRLPAFLPAPPPQIVRTAAIQRGGY